MKIILCVVDQKRQLLYKKKICSRKLFNRASVTPSVADTFVHSIQLFLPPQIRNLLSQIDSKLCSLYIFKKNGLNSIEIGRVN